MNSQIYSLPQKYGWAASTDKANFLHDSKNEYTSNRSSQPKFRVKFESFPRESLVKPITALTNGLVQPTSREDSYNQALMFSYRTLYQSEYGPDSVGRYRKQPPPRYHEGEVDQVSYKSRMYEPSIQSIKRDTLTGQGYDSDRGLYEWRQLYIDPGYGIWEPLQKIPFWRNGGVRSTLPPPRMVTHDPVHEKEKWDRIRSLDRSNCLAYGYRRKTVGYAGNENMVEAIDSQVASHSGNPAMESTAHAAYRGLPGQFYQHGDVEMINKYQGPLSRMVTLTHPYNPFTQQSAYPKVGAASTNEK